MIHTLYRRRLIPDECILLKDDIIRRQTKDVLVTDWKVLRPKKEFNHGCSCYFFEKGIKLSRFLRPDGSLYCIYIDIVRYEWEKSRESLTITDLLADVILFPDGRMQVVDLDELAEAVESGILSPAELTATLRKLDALLRDIYAGKLAELEKELE